MLVSCAASALRVHAAVQQARDYEEQQSHDNGQGVQQRIDRWVLPQGDRDRDGQA